MESVGIGAPETVEALARSQGAQLLRYAFLAGSRSEAEDIVQSAT
jgi:hypothetical protein